MGETHDDTKPPQGEPEAGQPSPDAPPAASAPAPAPASAPAPADTPPPEERLLPEGNPLRGRGGVALGLGALIAFVVMALGPQYRWGVPVGALGVVIATFGVLDLLGSFDDPAERVAGRASLRELAGPLALFFGGLAATAALVTLAVGGWLVPLPTWSPVSRVRLLIGSSAITIPIAFLTAVIGAYRIGERIGVYRDDETGAPRPMLRRHGFWLVVAVTLLYLPMLGNHALSDPWETHYGEVAREILARNDWISLWWAQDGWFWSKPVLDFWLQALAMAAFGVRYRAGEMLSAAASGHEPWPEWAVRLPIFLLTLAAAYLLYKAVARVFGRRAGLLGGLVLATMPQWFLVAHQTMTDMPFVATMAAAMALFLLGIHTDGRAEARVYEVDLGLFRLRLSAYHLVLGAIVACTLPQVIYLLSRHLEIRAAPFDLRLHADVFSSGSPGNCELPGNDACRATGPALRGLHPALQALIWLQALGIVLYLNWGERRLKRLCFLAAWFFAALSTMAKGPAGVGLPVLCALAYVVVSRRWRDLLEMEILSGLLILACVALPWFVAMYARHGQPFTDRLLFHDMFKRAFTHVHDTNEGDDVSFRYYVWQLGYAMFPWTGLVPAALVGWLRRDAAGAAEGERRTDASIFLVMWFLFAFALFSLMLTKFHHYILPAVPPAAMLTGVLLDDLLRLEAVRRAAARLLPDGRALEGSYRAAPLDGAAAQPASGRRGAAAHLAGVAAGTVVATAGIYLLLWRARPYAFLAGLDQITARIAGALLLLIGAGAVVASALVLGKQRGPEPAAEPPSERAVAAADFERTLLGAAAIGAAIVVFFVGRDLAMVREGGPSQIRLLHLFTYNYKRPWPPSLDFSASLWAFTAAAAALTLLLAVARWRRHVVIALSTVAVLFAAWGIDVYFVRASPHWGQRETMLAYVHANVAIPGPLVAYQMNWKGENFYSGNRVPAFVSSGKKFQDYINEQKAKGAKTFYFLTEHGRVGSLNNELGGPRVFEKLTTAELNNKFVLVRATFD